MTIKGVSAALLADLRGHERFRIAAIARRHGLSVKAVFALREQVLEEVRRPRHSFFGPRETENAP